MSSDTSPAIEYAFWIFAFAIGISFLLYVFLGVVKWIGCNRLPRERALSTFLILIFAALLFNLGVHFLIKGLYARPDSDAQLMDYYIRLRFLNTILSGMGVIGLIGWIGIAVRQLRDRQKIAYALQERQLTKYQIWLQDIFIGTLAAGLALTILRNVMPAQPDVGIGYVVFVGVFRLSGIVLGLLILVSVCRYSRTAKIPARRAIFMTVCLAVCLYWVGPFSLLATWLVWRKWLVRA